MGVTISRSCDPVCISIRRLKPVIDGRYELAEAGTALKRMQERSVTGKVVLVP